MLEQLRCKSLETHSGRIVPRMLSYSTQHPELFRMFFRKVMEPRRERYRTVLRAGVESGELRADLDVELTATLIAAPMMYLNMMQVGLGAPGPGSSEAIVDSVLGGIRASGAPVPARASGS